jgi:hypothetical protein
MSATGRRGVTQGSRGRRAGRIGGLAMALAAAWALIAAVAAGATTVTIGGVLPPTFTQTPFEGVRTQFNTTLPEQGAQLASPVAGAVVRWKMQGARGGPFTLRVLRPSGTGSFTAVATGAPVTPLGLGIETFTAQLPVRAGDLIAVDSSNPTDEIGVATVAGAAYGIFSQPPFEGATNAASQINTGKEIELAAEVQPAPAITSVTPAQGSVMGGETVTITGTNLAGTTKVEFGEAQATSFTVLGEEKITAVVPAQAVIGSVDITATTVAGQSPTSRSDSFLYRGCTVPKVAGKKLGQARTALREAGCTVGKVSKTKAPRRRGKVVRQAPKPSRVLGPNAKVALTLGR